MATMQNPYGHPRGTICVIRFVDGKPVALAIETQRTFAEWSGAFSIL